MSFQAQVESYDPMPLPKFTNDEQYLVNCVKSPNASANSSSYMWGYIIGGVVIAAFAAYYGSIPMMAAAFVIVCGFRVYEERFQNRWIPLWKSIIEKYESAAIDGDDNTANEFDADVTSE